MSSSPAINTFRNGDTSIANFTSMEQTILQVLRDKDNFELYNFSTGNSAVPGITAGSIVGVNYVLYPFDTTELAQYLSTGGVVADASTAPNGNYAIIAKPIVIDDIAYCSIYIYPYTSGQIIFEPTYGHYIISGTTNRVLGTCVKTGSAYSRKRLFPFNGVLSDGKVQIYQEGAELYGSLHGYADGETDSKLLLTSELTWNYSLQNTTVTITNPCHFRMVTDITVEGGDDYSYIYSYLLKFRPVANVGENKINDNASVSIQRYTNTRTVQVVSYGSLMPGEYQLTHQFTQRIRDGGVASHAGAIWMTSSLYIGNVYGSLTGKIL